MTRGVAIDVVLLGVFVFASAQDLATSKTAAMEIDGTSMSGLQMLPTGHATHRNNTNLMYEDIRALTDEEFQERFMNLSAEVAAEKHLEADELHKFRDELRWWAMASLSRNLPAELEEERRIRLQKLVSLETALKMKSKGGPHPWSQVEGAFHPNQNSRIKTIWGDETMNCKKATQDLTRFDAGQSLDIRCHKDLRDEGFFPHTAKPHESLKHLCPKTCMTQVQKTCEKCMQTVRFLLGPIFSWVMCSQSREGAYLPAPCTNCYMQLLIYCEVAAITPGKPTAQYPQCKACNDVLMSGCAIDTMTDSFGIVCGQDEHVNTLERCVGWMHHARNTNKEETTWCPMEVVMTGSLDVVYDDTEKKV